MIKLRTLSVGAAAFALLAAGTSTNVLSQPLPKGVKAKQFIGAENCAFCHGGFADKKTEEFTRKVTGDVVEKPGTYPKSSNNFALMRELLIWQKQDLHSLGFQALKSPLGVQMGKLLYGKPDAHNRAECLVCHAVDLKPGKPLEGRDIAKDFHTASDVGCEACHGIATKWYTSHTDGSTSPEYFRGYAPADKEKLGMWDIRDPVRRAERCASCHVGNWKESRFVTHEMYAAGHPPLLPLEVGAFSHDQPMHFKYSAQWPYISKLAASKDGAKEAWEKFHFRANESQQARQVAVAAVQTFGASMKLLADAAADPKTTVLDLAHFDCAACHHELEPFSWRQQRGYTGVPGRSQPRHGQAYLARMLAEASRPGEGEQLQGVYRQLIKAFDDRPFGDKARVAGVARQLEAWGTKLTGSPVRGIMPENPTDEYKLTDAVRGAMDEVEFTREKARQLIVALADASKAPPANPKDAWIDFDSAQQVVWAIESLRADADKDGKIGEALRGAKEMLRPQVRDPQKLDFIANGLRDRFERGRRFTPDVFYQTMAAVSNAAKSAKY